VKEMLYKAMKQDGVTKEQVKKRIENT